MAVFTATAAVPVMGMTLREGDREYYYQALDRHFPGLRNRYQKIYGLKYELISPRAEALSKLFADICRKAAILYRPEDVFEYMNEFPSDKGCRQLSLF